MRRASHDVILDLDAGSAQLLSESRTRCAKRVAVRVEKEQRRQPPQVMSSGKRLSFAHRAHAAGRKSGPFGVRSPDGTGRFRELLVCGLAPRQSRELRGTFLKPARAGQGRYRGPRPRGLRLRRVNCGVRRRRWRRPQSRSRVPHMTSALCGSGGARRRPVSAPVCETATTACSVWSCRDSTKSLAITPGPRMPQRRTGAGACQFGRRGAAKWDIWIDGDVASGRRLRTRRVPCVLL